jgi:multidrug resistance efflux pump
VSEILTVIVALIYVVEAICFAVTYLAYSRHYVVTDNAAVDADMIDVDAPATGTMRRWIGTEGLAMRKDDLLGRVGPAGGGRGPEVVVRAPRDGSLVVNDIADGEYVAAGQRLAIAYDLRKVWITARVDERDMSRVRIGEPVDITVDGFAEYQMTGVVTLIHASTAGQLSLYPSTDTDPTNVQKVDQYMAVRIVPTYTGGQQLRPGMSATVHIRTSQ